MFQHLDLRGRCKRLVAVGAAGALWAGVGFGQVGLGLSPMRLELAIGPGAVHSGGLSIRNEGDAPTRIRAEVLDFQIDSTATPQFSREMATEADYTCRKWLTVNPMEIEIGPQRGSLVRYTFRVPPSASPRSYHCAVGFSSLPTADPTNGSGIRAAVRVVAAFYLVVGDPKIEGEIRDVTLESATGVPGHPWRAVVTIRNSGRRYFRPEGELALIDADSKVVTQSSFPSLPVLPDRDQRFLFPLSVEPTGKLTLRARVGMGHGEIQEALVPVVLSKAP